MTNPLTDLAARVEAATGPDCDLDHAIHDLLGDNDGAPAYTRSLDAAMQLVPEGWASIHGWDYPDERCHRAVFMDEDGDLLFRGAAATPALALCAASLRARGSMAGG